MKHSLLIVMMCLSATTSDAEMGFDKRYERDYNIFAPTNQYALDNPLNPTNAYAPNNPFSPVNRYAPGNPANQYNPVIRFLLLDGESINRTRIW